jgi:hypothetical protein
VRVTTEKLAVAGSTDIAENLVIPKLNFQQIN